MSHERRLEQAEIYALGALDGVERAEFEAHLAGGCSVCEEMLGETHEGLAALAIALPPIAPPPALRDQVIAAVAADTGVDAEEAPFAVVARPQAALAAVGRGQSRGAAVWLAGASGIAAAGLLVALLVNVSARRAEQAQLAKLEEQASEQREQLLGLRADLKHRLDELEDQRRLAEEQISLVKAMEGDTEKLQSEVAELRDTMRLLEDPAVELVALSGAHLDPKPNGEARAWLFWDPEKKTGVILARGLKVPAGAKVYELWGIAKDHAPVPMNCYFRPDSRGCAVGRVQIDTELAFDAWAVSLEAEPGATTPTMPLQLAKI